MAFRFAELIAWSGGSVGAAVGGGVVGGGRSVWGMVGGGTGSVAVAAGVAEGAGARVVDSGVGVAVEHATATARSTQTDIAGTVHAFHLNQRPL